MKKIWGIGYGNQMNSRTVFSIMRLTTVTVLFLYEFYFKIKFDMAEVGQIYFQNGSTILHGQVLYLHDYIMYYLAIMLIIVSWLIVTIIYKYKSDNISLVDMNHNSEIEIFWTVVPTLILVILAIPSFQILYQLDSNFNCILTVKIVGSQWYWNYEITDYFAKFPFTKSFESYMIPTSDLDLGQFRLMEVDNILVLPIRKLIRIVVTSSDVIHSWSVPSFGIKIDAIPGRLNQVSLFIDKPGTYYGACQEICGIQHAFMPIKIIATNYTNYIVNLINN